MNLYRKCEVVIAGAGPAGLATALHSLRRQPQLAGRIVAIEKKRHPRDKVCAGGLIPRTISALDELGISLEIPSVQVYGGIARTPASSIDLGQSSEALCTIVRRREFDAMLASRARQAGLEIIEETRIINVRQGYSGAFVTTDKGVFEAEVLVGADGSGSRVRHSIFGSGKSNIGRALMVELAAEPAHTEEFVRRLYRFDFNCVAAGIRGYCWSFPCLVEGRAYLNLGIYAQNPHSESNSASTADLLAQLREAFPELRPDGVRPDFKAFPIRWYEPKDCYARERTILAGDAAGIDPLMGEGISFAFEHGKLAARAVSRYLAGDSSALQAYGHALHRGVIGRKLRRLAFAARRFYGLHHRRYFRLAGLSKSAQLMGVDWYNGTRRADELGTAAALLRVLSGMLFGAR
jgi:menaquinone-9 beta-reductase